MDCQMFGKRAEVLNKYLKKGDPIFLEGRLKFDSWQGQDGSKRSRLRVFVENFEFLGRGGTSGGGGAEGSVPGDSEQSHDAAGGAGDDGIPF